MKVGPHPQTNQKKSKYQMDAAETVKTIKTNLMISTKKHLSMSNHFPANSRIFNRSLQELQRTADVISSHYLANSRKAKNSKPTSNFFPPYEHEQSYQASNTSQDYNATDAIGVQNGMTVPNDLRVCNPTNSEAVQCNVPASNISQSQNKSKSSSASTREIDRKGHTRCSPYPLVKPSQTGVGSRTPQPRTAAPPLPLLPNLYPSASAEPPLVPLASHLPIRQPPVYNPPPVPVSLGPVKLPISGTSFNNNPNKCLLLNLGPQNPVILNKKQILETVSSRRPPGFGEATVQKSSSLPKTTISLPKSSARPCHNCQRLSKYLPFLGYSWRKLLGMDKSQVLSSLVLMCEVSYCDSIPIFMSYFLGLWPVREGDCHLRGSHEARPRGCRPLPHLPPQQPHCPELRGESELHPTAARSIKSKESPVYILVVQSADTCDIYVK